MKLEIWPGQKPSSPSLSPEEAPGRQLRICLVRAPLTLSKFASAAPAVPPIGLAYVAASLLARGHEVQIIDSVGDAIDNYRDIGDGILYRGLTVDGILDRMWTCDVVGISVMFSQDWPLARDLIQRVRSKLPDAIIVAGGEHVTAEPVGALEDAPGLDYVLVGEGDRVICDLLDHMQAGESVANVAGVYYRSNGDIKMAGSTSRIRAVDELPWPAWDLVPLENYLRGGHGWGVNRGRNMPIVASRGCPYQCTFCSNPVMWTQKWLVRPPEDVVKEIKFYIAKYRATNFDFQDLTAIIKKSWIIEFCNLLIAENLNITWQLPTGTRSEAIDEEVAPLLARSGCSNITYAPESGSEEVLRRIKKKVKPAHVLRSARACVKAGMNVKANFIFGFPEDTYRSHWPTFVFIWKMAIIGVYDISIAPFSAYPGSELFRQLQDQGRIPKKLDDEYYRRIPFSDMSKTESWAEEISPKGLNRLRNVAMLSFYLISYTLRPYRVFRTVWNFLCGREESRMDKALGDMRRRLLRIWAGKPGLAAGDVNPF
jgi:anaerobic magnesium-protoporphyrin IX monomethyl ester cyclase